MFARRANCRVWSLERVFGAMFGRVAAVLGWRAGSRRACQPSVRFALLDMASDSCLSDRV